METPFIRLDKKHGARIMQFIPDMAEQVVLLVTDREFGKEDENILDGNIKTDYTVIYQSEDEGLKIIKTMNEGNEK
jgi:DNA sulfur modification protein DndD